MVGDEDRIADGGNSKHAPSTDEGHSLGMTVEIYSVNQQGGRPVTQD